MRRLGALVLSGAAVLAASCAGLGTLEAPEVTLVDLRLSELTLFETSGRMVVRVSNENPEPLVVDGAVYALFLDGVKVGKALSDRRLEIPRLGSSTDDVEIHVNNVAVATRLYDVLQARALGYEIRSKLYVERPYGRRAVRFRHQGLFRFPEGGETAPPAPPGTSR